MNILLNMATTCQKLKIGNFKNFLFFKGFLVFMSNIILNAVKLKEKFCILKKIFTQN